MPEVLCAICLTTEKAEQTTQLQCSHIFCTLCIIEWFKIQVRQTTPTCPMCRVILSPTDDKILRDELVARGEGAALAVIDNGYNDENLEADLRELDEMFAAARAEIDAGLNVFTADDDVVPELIPNELLEIFTS